MSTDWIGIIISIISVVFAIATFIYTSRQETLATKEQTRVESVRATLTEFAALRGRHSQFSALINAQPENALALTKDYLSDLERFATGYNMGAYSLDVVNKMSGGMMVNLYRKHFRSFIEQRRQNLSLSTSVRVDRLYGEYLDMMRDLFELRGETFEDVSIKDKRTWILYKFLSMPISSSDEVFRVFATLPNAVQKRAEGKQRYLYVPGKRKDRCLLVAHADTVFDSFYTDKLAENELIFRDGVFSGSSAECSIGADDRAGCAMLWYLKDSGHSLLITDGEEHGQIGAEFLCESDPQLLEELNNHSFILQLDRRGKSDYKCYSIPVTSEFRSFIEHSTGYAPAEGKGKTDIIKLCKTVCGANLSIGYHDEHKPEETLVVSEWLHTLDRVEKMLSASLKHYATLRTQSE